MEKRKKRRLQNAVMVLLIVAIAISGVLAVGSYRGWFAEEGLLSVASVSGVATIERDGIAYTLSSGTALRTGDRVETTAGSQAELVIEGTGTVVLGERTALSVADTDDSSVSLEVLSGAVFASVGENTELTLTADGRTISARNAVCSMSVPTGSQTICVFRGSVSVTADGLQKETEVTGGQTASIVTDPSGEPQCTVTTLSASMLSDFFITQAELANDNVDLCFTNDELNAVLLARQEEAGAFTGGETITVDEDVIVPAAPPSEPGASSESESSSGGNASSTPFPSPSPSSSPAETDESYRAIYACTITIVCDTILDNMEELTEGKAQYVSASGTILATSTVQFYEGETVFDVLKRACGAAGIQLEYSWTPLYGSYYIEGINNLYEFDCGSESGWMYKVNGWFPNYGCSSYTLSDGDVIVWCYTCNGLGADVGGAVY